MEIKDGYSRYIKFLEFYIINEVDNKQATENHHILPKSMFPEYKSFKSNPWNKIKLPLNAHYLSHYILAKAYGDKMWFAFNMMKRTITGDVKKSSLYSLSRIYICSAISKSNKGRGNTEYNKQRTSEACIGTFVCENKEGHRIRLAKDDAKYTSGEYWSYREGFVHKESTKEKMREHSIKGKICYSKDGIIKYFSTDEVVPDGWFLGNTILKGIPKDYGMLWYSNVNLKKSSRFDKIEDVPSGWIQGRLYGNGFSHINGKNMKHLLNIHTLEKEYMSSADCALRNELIHYDCNDKVRFMLYFIDDKYFGSVSSADRYMRDNKLLNLTGSVRKWFTFDCTVTKHYCKYDNLQSKYLKNFLGRNFKDVCSTIDLREIKEDTRYNIRVTKY